MTSIILRTITRYLMPLLLMFSFFLLLRGHNEPGGGFVGGLIAATAWALYALGYSAREARRVLQVEPATLIGLGLLAACSSGIFALIAGEPFLTGQWGQFDLPGFGKIYIGTPLLFDLGVYLLVWGSTLSIILALAEE